MSGHDNPIAGHAQNSCSHVGASAGLVQLKKFSAKWSAPGGGLPIGRGGLPNYVTLYVANCKTWRVRWLSGSRSSSRIVK
jgi:hypothetical protein